MALKLNLGQINNAAGGNNDLRETLTGVYRELTSLYRQTGSGPLVKIDGNKPAFNAPPAKCEFTVTGGNGQFIVSIRLPQQTGGGKSPRNATNAPIYNELSSSPNADFSASTVTYPLSVNTSLVFPNPGASLYWRLRSSYDQRTWNSYQVFPGAVSAGKMSSAASSGNVILNQSNFAIVDSVADGEKAMVRIYGSGGPGTAWARVQGEQSELIPSGSILNVDYGATSYVAWDGSQYRLVPTLTQTFPDSWVPVGKVSVIANGAGAVLPEFKGIIASGAIVALQILNAGNGLTAPPAITISDSSGSGAKAACTVSGGSITGVTVTDAGSGYSPSPVITASGGISGGAGGGGGPAGSNGGRLYADV